MNILRETKNKKTKIKNIIFSGAHHAHAVYSFQLATTHLELFVRVYIFIFPAAIRLCSVHTKHSHARRLIVLFSRLLFTVFHFPIQRQKGKMTKSQNNMNEKERRRTKKKPLNTNERKCTRKKRKMNWLGSTTHIHTVGKFGERTIKWESTMKSRND